MFKLLVLHGPNSSLHPMNTKFPGFVLFDLFYSMQEMLGVTLVSAISKLSATRLEQNVNRPSLSSCLTCGVVFLYYMWQTLSGAGQPGLADTG